MRIITIASASVLLMLASTAQALVIGDAYYVGLINDGIPSDPENEVEYINAMIDLAPGTSGPCSTEACDRTGSTLAGLPDATKVGSAKDDTDPSTTVTTTGYAYILGKYDAHNAGSLVWYISGMDEVTLPSHFNSAGQYALSHWSLYNCVGECDPPNRVPEPTTLSLLGAAMLGSALLRRRRRMAA
jgi:hypothetical protein